MSTAADVPDLFGDSADVATPPDVTARLDQTSLAREKKTSFCYPDLATVTEMDQIPELEILSYPDPEP